MKPSDKTIAIVDDHEEVCELASRQLGKLGYKVHTFTDPRVFLEAMTDQGLTVDALMIDVAMPDVSGFDILEALEVRGLKPATVIVMTAAVEYQLQAEGFMRGATAVVAKPFDWPHIKHLLSTALGLG